MFNRPNQVIHSFFLICDIFALGLSFIMAYQLRRHLGVFTPVQPIAEYILPLLVFIMITLSIFQHQGLYRDIRDLSMLEEYAKIIKSLTYAILIALALTFFLKLYERSRVLVFIYWGLALVFLISSRFCFYRFLKWLRAKGWNQFHVALVGSEKKVKAIRHLLRRYPQLGYLVEVEVTLPPGASSSSENLRKKIDHEILGRYQRGEIQGVMVSDTVKNYQSLLEVDEILNQYNIPNRHVTETFDLAGFKAPSGEGLEGLVSSLEEGQTRGGYRVMKRFMDEILSLLAFLISSPLWIIVILAIKLDSQGPIFFRQERVGYLGKKFLIYKFRSMYMEAPRYAKTPRSHGDPRVTPIGRWLRKTSLDELPQLINVIKGDMSMVGPRPEMPFIVEKYKTIYRYRFSVLPGLTGLWQVSGRADKPLEENIKYDLYYIKNQSILLDLVILLRTIPTVLLGKGAY